MEIYLGKKGLKKTWQENFKPIIKCDKCGGKARVMFVGLENEEKNYICELHKTTGKEGGLWFHDAVAIAVYACQDCLEATASVNQA